MNVPVGEDMARLTFTKHLVPGEEVFRHTSANRKATYVECGSGELEQALKHIMKNYNESCEESQRLNIVFYPKFIDHVVKQCRLLVSSSTLIEGIVTHLF